MLDRSVRRLDSRLPIRLAVAFQGSLVRRGDSLCRRCQKVGRCPTRSACRVGHLLILRNRSCLTLPLVIYSENLNQGAVIALHKSSRGLIDSLKEPTLAVDSPNFFNVNVSGVWKGGGS